jgi:hypothetical protein
VPFVIDALRNGSSPNSGSDTYTNVISDESSVSKDTGILLALFAVGLLVGSPILGFLGNEMCSEESNCLVTDLYYFAS